MSLELFQNCATGQSCSCFSKLRFWALNYVATSWLDSMHAKQDSLLLQPAMRTMIYPAVAREVTSSTATGNWQETMRITNNAMTRMHAAEWLMSRPTSYSKREHTWERERESMTMTQRSSPPPFFLSKVNNWNTSRIDNRIDQKRTKWVKEHWQKVLNFLLYETATRWTATTL